MGLSFKYPNNYLKLPTWLSFVLWNHIEQSVKASVGGHRITLKHHCHDVWGGEKHHSYWGTELPHGEWGNSGTIEDFNWVIGASKDIFQSGGIRVEGEQQVRTSFKILKLKKYDNHKVKHLNYILNCTLICKISINFFQMSYYQKSYFLWGMCDIYGYDLVTEILKS